MEGLDMHKKNRHVCIQWSVFQLSVSVREPRDENQSLLDSHPDLLVHMLVKMNDQKTFDKRGPKDQDPTKIMGQKDHNSAKWGVGRKKNE